MSKLLSQGGFGCVYYPGIKCDGNQEKKTSWKHSNRFSVLQYVFKPKRCWVRKRTIRKIRRGSGGRFKQQGRRLHLSVWCAWRCVCPELACMYPGPMLSWVSRRSAACSTLLCSSFRTTCSGLCRRAPPRQRSLHRPLLPWKQSSRHSRPNARAWRRCGGIRCAI